MTGTPSMVRQLLLAALAGFAQTAHAVRDAVPPTRPVALLAAVEFADHATAMDWIKDECDLQKTVLADVGESLRRDGVGGDTTTALASGYVLKVSIERANAQKGGVWSGPKTLSLSAQLFGDGVLLRSTEVSYEAKSLNFFGGSCPMLRKAAGVDSRHISEWLRNPDLAKTDHLAAPAAAASPP
jgi:hypothetical protein